MSLWLRKHYSLVSEAYILLLVFSPGVLKIKMKYHKNYVTKDKKKETVCVCINEDVAKCSKSTKTVESVSLTHLNHFEHKCAPAFSYRTLITISGAF